MKSCGENRNVSVPPGPHAFVIASGDRVVALGTQVVRWHPLYVPRLGSVTTAQPAAVESPR